MSLFVEIDDGRLVLAFRQLTNQIPEAPTRWLNEGAEIVKALAQEEAPFRTGSLRESIAVRQTAPLERQIIAEADHAVFVVKGTRPHRILPKRAKALHFFVDGGEVFATRVEHPGTQSNPFMERAKQRALAPLRELASKLLQEILH